MLALILAAIGAVLLGVTATDVEDLAIRMVATLLIVFGTYLKFGVV